jgi:hypothetical protein
LKICRWCVRKILPLPIPILCANEAQ